MVISDDPVFIRCARPTGAHSNSDSPGTRMDHWTRSRMAKVACAMRARCNVPVYIKLRHVKVGHNLDYDAKTDVPHHLSWSNVYEDDDAILFQPDDVRRGCFLLHNPSIGIMMKRSLYLWRYIQDGNKQRLAFTAIDLTFIKRRQY